MIQHWFEPPFQPTSTASNGYGCIFPWLSILDSNFWSWSEHLTCRRYRDSAQNCFRAGLMECDRARLDHPLSLPSLRQQETMPKVSDKSAARKEIVIYVGGKPRVRVPGSKAKGADKVAAAPVPTPLPAAVTDSVLYFTCRITKQL